MIIELFHVGKYNQQLFIPGSKWRCLQIKPCYTIHIIVTSSINQKKISAELKSGQQ